MANQQLQHLWEKEISVFNSRLKIQLKKLSEYKYSTKFGGAVGNLNAHYFSYPDKHWELFMNGFCNKYELTRNKINYTSRPLR